MASAALDLLRSAAFWLRDLPRQLLMGSIRAYRLLLRPWLGNACRFEPTCSAYTLEALQRHGALRGTALGGWRLLRCHPWCEAGYDPVPDNPAGLFSRLLPGGQSPSDQSSAQPGTTCPANDPRVSTRKPP